MKSISRMTQKKENFCLAYLETGNQSEAYRRAYNAENMKQASIARKASELMRDGYVSARVKELQTEQRKRFEITVANTLEELARIAFFDPRKMFHGDGRLKCIDELDEDTAAVLAGFDVITAPGSDKILETKKIKFHNKLNALDQIGRHLGLFRADNDQGRKMLIIKDFTGC